MNIVNSVFVNALKPASLPFIQSVKRLDDASLIFMSTTARARPDERASAAVTRRKEERDCGEKSDIMSSRKGETSVPI